MEYLRIILIILGILLVVGIWLAERIRRHRQLHDTEDWAAIDSYNEDAVSLEETYPDLKKVPNPDEWVGKAFIANRHDELDDSHLDGLKGLGEESASHTIDELPATTTARPADTPSENPAPRKKAVTKREEPAGTVIVLTVLAQERKRLRGPLLLKALQDCGLSHGEMDIFHYHVEGHAEPLFSVANVLEPGKFILSEMAQFETPGVALFMQLPTVMPGSDALHLMLQKARQLAAQLSATLCDGQRQPLDDAALAAMERRVAEFTSPR